MLEKFVRVPEIFSKYDEDGKYVKRLGEEVYYNKKGKIVEKRLNNYGREYYDYDNKGRLIKTLTRIQGICLTETIEYKNDKVISYRKELYTGIKGDDIIIDNIQFEYDAKNRLIRQYVNGESMQISYNQNGTSVETYSSGHVIVKDLSKNVITASYKDEMWHIDYNSYNLPIKFTCNDGRYKLIAYENISSTCIKDKDIAIIGVTYKGYCENRAFRFEWDGLDEQFNTILSKIEYKTANIISGYTVLKNIYPNDIYDVATAIDWNI